MLRQSNDLPELSHEHIFDLCSMTNDALKEEFDAEFEHLDNLRYQTDDLGYALGDPLFARFETLRLARMLNTLSNVAIGGSTK